MESKPLGMKMETVTVDRRVAGFVYVMRCVAKSYPDTMPSLANVGRLIDQVAEAVEKNDGQSMMVYGLRLLSVAELDTLVGMLRRSATATSDLSSPTESNSTETLEGQS